MNDLDYKTLMKAKSERNIELFNQVYSSNSDNSYTKYEYGKFLIKNGKRKDGKKILLELVNSENNIYAKLALGKLEISDMNTKMARFYLESLIGTKLELSAYFELSKLEYKMGNIEKAKEYLQKLLGTELEIYAYSLLITIEIKDKHYERAAYLVEQALPLGYQVKDDIFMELSKKLNIFFDIKYRNFDNYSYTVKQIISYDSSLAVDHIIERHKKDFNRNIDIKKLFEEIKKQLIKENKLNIIHFNDLYVIPFKNIGNNTEKLLEVVTLPATNNILTMYPIGNLYDIEADDFDCLTMKKELKDEKIKTLTNTNIGTVLSSGHGQVGSQIAFEKITQNKM